MFWEFQSLGTAARSTFIAAAFGLAACGGESTSVDAPGEISASKDSPKVSEAYAASDFESASFTATINGDTYNLSVFRTCFASPSVSTITEHASNVVVQETDSLSDPGVFVRLTAFTQSGKTEGSVGLEDGETTYLYEGPFELDGNVIRVQGAFKTSKKQENGTFDTVGEVEGIIKVKC